MSLVAQTDPAAPAPGETPWWMLLLAIPLVALALVAVVRRAAEEGSPF
jgi:hypothetical protein